MPNEPFVLWTLVDLRSPTPESAETHGYPDQIRHSIQVATVGATGYANVSPVARWGELTREQLAADLPDAVLVLPVAAIEQHGPHLATSTDTVLVTAIAERAAALAGANARIILAPTLCFGASDHHLPFGGTLSLAVDTLRLVLSDLVDSAAQAGARRIMLLNGHGGNAETCRSVAAHSARARGITVAAASYWELLARPDRFDAFPGHAGAFETSLMLALCPDLVRIDRARPSPGTLPPAPTGLYLQTPDLWQRIDGFTDNPRLAQASVGETMLATIAEAVAHSITALGAT